MRPKTCPGCGYVIRAFRVKVTVGDRVRIVERVVAIPPDQADKFMTVAEAEKLFDNGGTEEPGPIDE